MKNKMLPISINNILIFLFSLSFLQFNFFPGGRYFLTFILIIVSLIIIVNKSIFLLSDFIYFLLFLFLGILLVVQSQTEVEFVNSILKCFFLYGAFFIASKIDFSRRKSRVLFFTTLNLVALTVLVLDFLSRYNAIGFDYSRVIANFYMVKFNSIIFTDTNGVGLYIAIVMGINFLFYKSVNVKQWKYFQFSLLFLMLTTMSRTAIIASVIGYLYFYIFVNFSRINVFIRFFLILFIPFVTCLSLFFSADYIINKMVGDGSGSSKIQTFIVVYSNVGLNMWQDLIGYGLEEGSLYYSFVPHVRYAHAAIPLLLGMVGVLGTIIYTIIVLSPIFKNLMYIPSVIMFFIIGLSYLEVWYESLFFLVGLAINGTLSKTFIDEYNSNGVISRFKGFSAKRKCCSV